MITPSTLAQIATLPEDVTALRCALFNRSGQKLQVNGIRSAVQKFYLFFRHSGAGADQAMSGNLHNKYRLTMQTLVQQCSNHGIPLTARIVPEGSVLQSDNVIMTMDSTDKKFPWLPLLFSEYSQYIESCSALTLRIHDLKAGWDAAIEASVDNDKIEFEKAFKLRPDAESISEDDAHTVATAVFGHYPLPISMHSVLGNYSMLRSSPPLKQFGWSASVTSEHNVRRMAIFSSLILDKMGYDPSTYINFFKKHSAAQGMLGIEYTNGFHPEELPSISAILAEISKELGKPVYFKPEGILTSQYTKETSPITGRLKARWSQLGGGHTTKHLQEWFSTFKPSEYSVNSKGYKVAPVRLLVPLIYSNQQEQILDYLMNGKLSAENVDFYIPHDIMYYINSQVPRFDWVPIAWKRGGDWEPIKADDPISPTLFYDKNLRQHFTADVNAILESDKLDLVEELVAVPGLNFRSSIADFLMATQTKGSFVQQQEETDPLLM